MMYTPKVSVIIPVYNQEVLVLKALDSIPTRDDIEIIVIDDGSTDDTWTKIWNYTMEHPKKNRLCKKKHLPSSLSSENFDTTGSPITDNEYEIDSDFSYNNEFQNSIIIEE